VAIPASGVDRNAGYATGDTSATSARDTDRLLSIDEMLYPAGVTILDD
jgi:hypothetical protein